MYTQEIDEIIRSKGYVITRKQYFDICNSSPQISHIHYDAYWNRYHIYTEDGGDWEFSIRKDD